MFQPEIYVLWNISLILMSYTYNINVSFIKFWACFHHNATEIVLA